MTTVVLFTIAVALHFLSYLFLAVVVSMMVREHETKGDFTKLPEKEQKDLIIRLVIWLGVWGFCFVGSVTLYMLS